jgi:hydrogenase maturation factor
VLVGPAFGLDAAVVDLGPQYLILKSDPVTFTTEEVGWYAVHVNANDVAVMGARPRSPQGPGGPWPARDRALQPPSRDLRGR